MSLSTQTMQSLMKHVDFNNLPHQCLIDIIRDLEESIKKDKNVIKEINCKYEKLIDAIHKGNDELHDEISIKNETTIKEKNQKISELERQVEDLQNVNDELKNNIYDGPNPAGEVPDIPPADHEELHSVTSDEELQDMKMANFENFIQRCCIWSNVHIKVRCSMTKQIYHVAHSSCRELYQAFKEWCLKNNIITSLAQSKNIPSTKQFYALLVEGHQQRYPEDWCQNGDQYPRSPNGSYKTPRVNLRLYPDFIEK